LGGEFVFANGFSCPFFEAIVSEGVEGSLFLQTAPGVSEITFVSNDNGRGVCFCKQPQEPEMPDFLVQWLCFGE
jgi:hypothetical protein